MITQGLEVGATGDRIQCAGCREKTGAQSQFSNRKCHFLLLSAVVGDQTKPIGGIICSLLLEDRLVYGELQV